jgi:hypothetical protein
MTDRKASIEAAAEKIALGLIRDGLTSTDPKHAELIKRLAPFKPLLQRHGTVDEKQVTQVLRNGIKVVRLKPDPNASDDAEVLRLLNALADKLGGMAKMMGLLKR